MDIMSWITPPVALVFIPSAVAVLTLAAYCAGKLRGRLSPAQNCQHLVGALCIALFVVGIGMSLYPGPLTRYELHVVQPDGTLAASPPTPMSYWFLIIGLTTFSAVGLCWYVIAVYAAARDLLRRAHPQNLNPIAGAGDGVSGKEFTG